DLKNMRRWQTVLMYALLVVIVLMVVNMTGPTTRDTVLLPDYSSLLTMIDEGKIANIELSGATLIGRLTDSTIPLAEFGKRYDLTTTISSHSQFYEDVNKLYAKKLGKPVAEVPPRTTALRRTSRSRRARRGGWNGCRRWASSCCSGRSGTS
ncbi:MAG: hypothetical protein RR739_01005, partial [Clostridia bacterium]